MKRSPPRYLALLLALLMGLIPMQGVLAGLMAGSMDHIGHHGMESEGSSQLVYGADPAAVDCGGCPAGHFCEGQGCASGHCVSCVAAIILQSYRLGPTGTEPSVPLHNSLLPPRIPAAVFRPPRA